MNIKSESNAMRSLFEERVMNKLGQQRTATTIKRKAQEKIQS